MYAINMKEKQHSNWGRKAANASSRALKQREISIAGALLHTYIHTCAFV